MKRHLFFISLFIILIVLLNLPVVFGPNHKIPAFSSTDEPYAAIWDFWRINHGYNNHLALNFTNLINYPSGVNLFSSFYVWMKLNYLLAISTNPALTYNIQILMNFFLSALFLYLLVFFLTKSRLAALFSGVVFSFSPQHFVRVWQHLGLTYFEWIPLIILAAILLKESCLRSGRAITIGNQGTRTRPSLIRSKQFCVTIGNRKGDSRAAARKQASYKRKGSAAAPQLHMGLPGQSANGFLLKEAV